MQVIFLNNTKDKIIYLQRDKYDRSKEQIEYALADIILLTRTKLFLGSTWSSFSELVLRMAPVGQKYEMSGVDF